MPELSPLVGEDEWPALLERAPLDLRVNVARATRDEHARRSFRGAEPTPLSPWGMRLPADSRVDDHPAFADGLVEVQDEGSQLIALACEPRDGERILDLCAGAGGKALALAAAAPGATILATDSNRARLSKLAPRAERAGRDDRDAAAQPAATSSTSSPTGAARPTSCWSMRPARAAAPGGAIPEGRWRLTPERLDRLVALQARLLDIAAELVGPAGGWSMRSARCCPAKGQGRLRAFSAAIHRGLVQETPFAARAFGRCRAAADPGPRRHRRLFRRAARPSMLGRRD